MLHMHKSPLLLERRVSSIGSALSCESIVLTRLLGRWFAPGQVVLSFAEFDHEIFSTVILSPTTVR